VAICIFWGAYYRAIGDDGFVGFGPPIAGSRGAAPEKNSEFKLKSNHVRLTITLTITVTLLCRIFVLNCITNDMLHVN
jgi:hypothetical protein